MAGTERAVKHTTSRLRRTRKASTELGVRRFVLSPPTGGDQLRAVGALHALCLDGSSVIFDDGDFPSLISRPQYTLAPIVSTPKHPYRCLRHTRSLHPMEFHRRGARMWTRLSRSLHLLRRAP